MTIFTRQQKIKLFLSLAGVAFAIFIGSIYFIPLINNQQKLKPVKSVILTPQINYDSIATTLLKDKTSYFRKAVDSLIVNKFDSLLNQNKKLTQKNKK